MSKKCVTALPISSIFSALVNMPIVDEKNIKSAIEAQAAKLSPWQIGEAVLDWKILPKESKDAKNFLALITGAEKSSIKKYIEVFKAAELKVVSLETEASALIRSLIGDDKASVAILEIGAERTNVVIASGSVPIMSRSIDFGGKAFTLEFSKLLGMEATQAEEFKLDAEKLESLLPSESVLSETYKTLLRPVLNEIKYSIDLYLNQNKVGAAKVEKIVMTGGSCLLPGLAAFLSDYFKMRAYVGDPWARTIYPEDLRPLLDKIGPRFAVAIGLAMREIGKQ